MKTFLILIVASLCVHVVQGRSFPEVKTFSAPEHPYAARAVRAEGDVQVLVEVDAKGNVVSASAVTGHKLLQKTSEVAAKKWTFTADEGNHFLILKFLFRLSDYTDKRTVKLVAGYTLRFSEPKVQILQMKSHPSERRG